MFVPQQYYLIGFVQDTWRATSRLTLELGLRYDFYSVVQEKSDQARPFFIEENAFSDDPDNFYNADRNNISPRLSAVFQINDKTGVGGPVRDYLYVLRRAGIRRPDVGRGP